MCGIAGVFRFGDAPPPDEALLVRMADTLVHRGPDGAGYSVRGPIGLAHRRLAIIDLAGGRQPMGNEDGTVEVTFNGEIYNFEELRSALVAKGHLFRTRSDTEVLVHLYEEEGDRLVEKLRGEFAFVIADHRRRRVVMARDRVGVKPLYYSIDSRQLVFGSEAKAVLAEGSAVRDVDPSALLDYLTFRYVPSPRTIYPGIRKLPPATVMTIEGDGRVTERRYWRLRFETARGLSAESWCERIRDQIADSVRAEMVADVPVGGFLSGGVDSSAVVSFMAKASERPVVACTIGSTEKEYDEVAFATEVARRVGADHRVRVMDAKAVEVVERLAWHYDEPFGDSSAVPTWYVSKMAREHVTVALSGDGGDEAYAGYRRYRFDQAENRVRAFLPAFLRRPVFGALASVWPKGDRLPRFLRAQTTFRNLAESDPALAYARSVGTTAGFDRATLLRAETLRAAAGHDPRERIVEAFRAAAASDPLSRAQSCDIDTWLPEDMLTKVDRASMGNSLEVRVPLLDHVHLELAAQIPPGLRIRGGEGKWILKRALEPLLPRDVLYRPKRGFSVPVREWLRRDLHDFAADLLFAPSARIRDHFDTRAVRSLWDDHQSGARDGSDLLWLLLTYENFARRHLTAPAAPSERKAAAPLTS